MSLDRESLRAYCRQWQMVAELNRSERQRETVTERWLKLNSLLRLAAALGLHQHRLESQSTIPRQRWNRLREMHLAARPEEPR